MDPRPADDFEATGTQPLGGEDSVPVATPEPEAREQAAWVQQARESLTVPGRYLAYEENGRHVVMPVTREWTRIGRSLAADVRFDDATVSRRHALLVSQDDGVRVLDDRSLNGVYVNGERVESSPLSDGDEISVGRHPIVFMDTATVGAAGPEPAAVGE